MVMLRTLNPESRVRVPGDARDPLAARRIERPASNGTAASSILARGTFLLLAQRIEHPRPKRSVPVRIRGGRQCRSRLTVGLRTFNADCVGSTPTGGTAGNSTGCAGRPHKPIQVGSTPAPAPVPVAHRESAPSTAGRRLVRHQPGTRMARWAKWVEPPDFQSGHLAGSRPVRAAHSLVAQWQGPWLLTR
jgi:hypothetical protein